MKLWVDGQNGSAGSAIRATIKEQVTDINRKVVSRGVRAVNALRTAELQVLKGQRHGNSKARVPYSKKIYTASAPGEPPARRTGNLRMHWNGQVKSEGAASGGITVVAQLESQERYAAALEYGTRHMAPRPFVEKIKEKAAPEIQKIYSQPYT